MITRIALISTILFLLLPAQIEAHSGTWYVTSTSGLRLRSGPGTKYKIIEVLPYRAAVTAKKHRSNWVYVSDNGTLGWVSGDYISQTKPASGSGGGSGLQTCFDTSWGDVACSPDWIAEDAYNAASYYGISYWYLMSLAACESRFNPDEVSWAGAIGVWQFLPDTFYDFSSGDIWSVADQAYAAAKAISRGYQYYWDCDGRF